MCGGFHIRLKSKVIFISLVIMILLSISLVSAADNNLNNNLTHEDNSKLQNTYSNHILGDENSGSFTDLQDNVSSASNTLNLNRNYTYNSTIDASISVEGIKINKSLTIDGNGYTIDANNFGRIFNINASDVILKNIIFINSHYAGKGGAIFGI